MVDSLWLAVDPAHVGLTVDSWQFFSLKTYLINFESALGLGLYALGFFVECFQ